VGGVWSKGGRAEPSTRAYHVFVYLACGCAVAVGAADLFGWAYHVEPLLSVYPGLPKMVPNTAVGVIAAGLSIGLVQSARVRVRRAGQALALVLLVFAALTLAEHATGWYLGIDDVLFEGARMIPSAPSGRPGLFTPIALAALSTGVLFLDVQLGRDVRPSEVLALVTILIALQVVAGYVYGAESLYARPGPSAMSLAASLSFLALGLAVLWARPHSGLMSVVTSGRLGGRVATRFLVAVFALLGLGLLVMLGQHAGLYGKPIAGVLLAMGGLAVWLPVLLATSRSLNRVDAERERYEFELERWEIYFAHAAWGALVANPSGTLLIINRAFADMYGSSLEALAGKSLFSILAPTRPEELQARLTAAAQSGRHRFEWDEQVADGRSARVLLVDVTVIQDGRGRLLHYALYVDDITAQKQANVEREQLLARVQDANARIGLLAETSSTLARSLEHETTLKALARLMVPRLADDCVIHLTDDLSGTSRIAASAHVDPTKGKLLTESRTWPSDRQAPLPWGRALGPRSFVSVPMIAHARRLGGMALAYSDSNRRYESSDRDLAEQIAGRAAVAIENSRLYQQAVAAVRARDDILAIVSHDLRNPLAVVDLNAHLLAASEAGVASKSSRAVESIRKAVKRMATLIDDLLTASATESGSLVVERKPCAMSDVIQETFELIEPLATAKSVRLESNVPPFLRVLCDRQRTIQILTNLIGNSIKFTPEGRTVYLGAETLGEEIRVGVSDTGPGIAKQNLPHIFDRFWKGHVSGTGLGLFIAKCLVEAQGGSIWVDTQAGAGTTFFFTLPLVAPSEIDGARATLKNRSSV
jgi:PAS domain S-box-containing protein